jgi:hypothetical protein
LVEDVVDNGLFVGQRISVGSSLLQQSNPPPQLASMPAGIKKASDSGVGSMVGQPNVNGYTNAVLQDPAKISSEFFGRAQDAERWPAAKQQTCPVDWSKAVEQQLENWKVLGISQEDVDKYCLRKSFRISIVGGEIRVATWSDNNNSGLQRLICMLWLLQIAILRAASLGRSFPDVELVAQTSDGPQSGVDAPYLHWENPGPLFGHTKCRGDASVSFPMGIHDRFGSFASGAMSFRMYEENWAELAQLGTPGDTTAWKAKASRMFFSAGKLAGKGKPSSRGHRANLFHIDSPLLTVTEDTRPLKEYAEFKYSIYAYGRCGWSRRIHELAFIESAMFIEDSECTEYFMEVLEPGKDYVPVAEDFSDLVAKLEEVHSDPKRARALAVEWLKHARPMFSLACILDYVENIINGYAGLQKFKPQPRPDWKLYDIRENDAHTIKFFSGTKRSPEECPSLVNVTSRNQRMNC